MVDSDRIGGLFGVESTADLLTRLLALEAGKGRHMAPHRILFWLLFGLLITPRAHATCAAADANIVRLLHGGSFELGAGDPGGGPVLVTVRVPLAFCMPGDKGPFALSLLDVARGQLHEPAWQKGIKVSLDDDRDLLLTVDGAQVAIPGTYDLLVRVRATVPAAEGQPNAPAEQDLAIQLIRPEGQLRPPDKLIIDRTQPPWGSASPDLQPPLYLSETTRRSALTPLTIRQVGSATMGEKVVSGRLDCLSIDVPPGGTVTSTCKIVGEFAVGMTSGILEISAPQMKSVISTPFVVRTRRTPWFLVLCFGAGLTFGWIIRVQVKRYLEQQALRIKALELLTRIRRQGERHPDAVLAKTLETLRSKIQEELDKSDASADLLSVLPDKDKALTEAMADLEKRWKEGQASLDVMRRSLGTTWSVPPTWRVLLRDALGQLEQVQAQLDAGDVSGASDTRQWLERRLAQELLAAAKTWQSDVKKVVILLANDKAPIPSVLSTWMQDAAKALGDALDALPLKDVSPVLEDLLRKSHDAREKLRTFIEDLFREAAVLTEQVAGSLSADQRSKLLGLSESLGSSLAFSEASFEDVLHGLLPQLKELGTRLAEQVSALPEGLSKEDISRIKALIAARKYGEAAQTIREVRPAVRSIIPTSYTSNGDPAGSQDAARGQARQGTGPEMPRPPDLPPRQPRPDMKEVPLDVQRVRAGWRLWAAEAVQSLAVLVGLGLASYLLYADSFVGTDGELIGFFFGGFWTDISIDALRATTNKLSKSIGS